MSNLTPQKRIFGLPPLLILIFFFLPWVTLSCSGESSSVSGYQLAVEGSDIPADIRIPILVIGIAAVVALAVVAATSPLNRRYYTGAGLLAGASYLYLLVRFGSVSQDARDQGGTLTLELAVWGVGLAIIAIIGLGALYRPDESDSAASDSDGAAAADRSTQQAKIAQYVTYAGLALVGGIFLVSVFQSIGADLERRQEISNATATQVAATQEYLAFRATADANFAIATQTAVANAQLVSQIPTIVIQSSSDILESLVFTTDGRYILRADQLEFYNFIRYDTDIEDISMWDVLTGDSVPISPADLNTLELFNPTNRNWGSSVRTSLTSNTITTYSGDRQYKGRITFGDDTSIIVIQNLDTAQELNLSAARLERIGIIFNPDGSRFATVESSGAIQLRDITNGEILLTVGSPEESRGVAELIFSPDGTKMAALYDVPGDYSLLLWDTETGDLILRQDSIASTISWFAFDHSSTRLVAQAGLNIWDAVTGQLIMGGDGSYSDTIVFNRDRAILAYAEQNDGRVRLWDVLAGEEIDIDGMDDYYYRTSDVSLSADARLLAIGTTGGEIILFDLEAGYQIAAIDIEASQVTFSPSAYLLAVKERSGERIRLFDLTSLAGEMPIPTSVPTRTPAPTLTPTITLSPTLISTPTLTRTPAPPTVTHTPAPPTATLAEADVIATGVAATVAALQAPTQNPTPVIEYTLNCSQSVSSLGLTNGTSVVAVCAQNCAQSGGTVWGTDIYTHDSSICRAALHSGISANQPFRIEVLPGQSSYQGSTRNGIQTFNYGSWDRSFRVTVIE